MTRLRFREARREDVPAIVAMLADDRLGQGREQADMAVYLAAFDALGTDQGNLVIVGEDESGTLLATYQITYINGLSLAAARRAQVESVRVASDRRGQGLGAQLIADAEARARDAGCRLLQLTMNAAREDAHRFYRQHGFEASHVGFKKPLD